jgi:hypothetical protein
MSLSFARTDGGTLRMPCFQGNFIICAPNEMGRRRSGSPILN